MGGGTIELDESNRVAKPTPGVAWKIIPRGLRGKIEALLSDYQGLWAGQ